MWTSEWKLLRGRNLCRGTREMENVCSHNDMHLKHIVYTPKTKSHSCFQDEFISFFLVYKISFILWESHMQTQHILLIFSTSSPLHPLLTTCGILIVSVVMTEWSLKEMILKMKNAAISDILIWGWILIWNDNIHSFHLMVTSPANLELGKHHSNHKFVLT